MDIRYPVAAPSISITLGITFFKCPMYLSTCSYLQSPKTLLFLVLAALWSLVSLLSGYYSFSSCQRFSIGLRSGDSAGVFHQFTPFSSIHSLAYNNVRLGSLPCISLWPSGYTSLTKGSRVLSRILTNSSFYMIPSKIYIPVHPRLAHTCTLVGCLGLKYRLCKGISRHCRATWIISLTLVWVEVLLHAFDTRIFFGLPLCCALVSPDNVVKRVYSVFLSPLESFQLVDVTNQLIVRASSKCLTWRRSTSQNRSYRNRVTLPRKQLVQLVHCLLVVFTHLLFYYLFYLSCHLRRSSWPYSPQDRASLFELKENNSVHWLESTSGFLSGVPWWSSGPVRRVQPHAVSCSRSRPSLFSFTFQSECSKGSVTVLLSRPDIGLVSCPRSQYAHGTGKGSGNIVHHELSQRNSIIAYVTVFNVILRTR